MRSPTTLFIFLALLILLAEYYGYQSVRTLTQHLPPGTRRGLAAWATGCSRWAVWALAIWAGATRGTGSTIAKSYLMSLPLLLLAAKVIILIPLLLEDLTRLGRWAVGLATRPAGSGRAGHSAQRVSWRSWHWAWARCRWWRCSGAW